MKTQGKVLIEVKQPMINFVKLKVLKDLQIGDVFYTEGHEIEVFHPEAVQLLTDYADYFEVISS